MSNTKAMRHLDHEGLIAYGLYRPDGEPIQERAGETDAATIRACVQLLQKSGEVTVRVLLGDVTVSLISDTERVAAVMLPTGHTFMKSASRAMRRALKAASRPATDDEPTQVYRPGEAVMMTPANTSPATP